MPEISRFYGIVVFMNFNEHNPPHFHVNYQDQEITMEIQTGIIQGKMAKRALQMVFEWAEKYRDDLMENWNLARARKSLKRIPPLT
ncbi:MAG: DUF4160 domain-containing protein [bacterium]